MQSNASTASRTPWLPLDSVPDGGLIPALLLGGHRESSDGQSTSQRSVVVVEGPASVGKSTLLNAICAHHAFPYFASPPDVASPTPSPRVAWRGVTVAHGTDGRVSVGPFDPPARATLLAVRRIEGDPNEKGLCIVAPIPMNDAFLRRHGAAASALEALHASGWQGAGWDDAVTEQAANAAVAEGGATIPAVGLDAPSPPNAQTVTLVESRGVGERWPQDEVHLWLSVVRVGESTTVGDVCAQGCRRRSSMLRRRRGVILNVDYRPAAANQRSTHDGSLPSLHVCRDDVAPSPDLRIDASTRVVEVWEDPSAVTALVNTIAHAWDIGADRVWCVDGRAALARALLGTDASTSTTGAMDSIRRACFADGATPHTDGDGRDYHHHHEVRGEGEGGLPAESAARDPISPVDFGCRYVPVVLSPQYVREGMTLAAQLLRALVGVGDDDATAGSSNDDRGVEAPSTVAAPRDGAVVQEAAARLDDARRQWAARRERAQNEAIAVAVKSASEGASYIPRLYETMQ